MKEALKEARNAFDRDEVPIGCVAVHPVKGEILSRASNRTIEMSDPTAHAEILAIRKLCKEYGAQRIPEIDLYVTLEPCPMCAAAISYARLNHIYIGAIDPKSGGVLNGPKLYDFSAMHHKPGVSHGYLEADCARIIRDFFKIKRQK